MNDNSEVRYRGNEEDQGHTDIPNAVLLESRIEPMTRLCYAVVKSYAYGKKREAFPGQKAIAEQLGVRERSVRYYITDLEKLGLLTVEQRGQQQTNVYWIESLAGLEDHIKAYQIWKAEARKKKSDRQPIAAPDRQPIADEEYKEDKNTSTDSTFTNVQVESGAPSDSIGKEIDDLPETPQLKIAKAAKAITTLSKRSESEQQDVPRRCPVQECGGELDAALKCPICGRQYVVDDRLGLRTLRLDPPSAGEQSVAFRRLQEECQLPDGPKRKQLALPPIATDFYVILDDKAIGPFKAIGKELLKVVQETGGRVSNSGPEGRPVEAPQPKPARACKAKAEPKPRPRNPVFDAIALSSYFMKSAPPGGYIGKLAAGVTDCTPEENRETLAEDLKAMYAWYRTAHKDLDAPAKIETICKYLAEWRMNGNGNSILHGDDNDPSRAPDFDWGYRDSVPPVQRVGLAERGGAPGLAPGGSADGSDGAGKPPVSG